jgi:hypothetical protein
MPTVEEEEAHIAYMDAWLKKCRLDSIAEAEARLETERNPYVRESLLETIAHAKAKLAESD